MIGVLTGYSIFLVAVASTGDVQLSGKETLTADALS